MTMDPIFPHPALTAPLSLPALPASTFPASTAPATPVSAVSERDRIGRLIALSADDMAAGLLWLAMNFPAVCDALLDKVECDAIDDEFPSEEPEPFCVKCGAPVGIFLAHGTEYRHYRGVLSPTGKPKPTRQITHR
jgi:hypothetical protein